MVNLTFVYFFEYTIITCFTDRITKEYWKVYPEQKSQFVYANAFTIFNFCYQVGVFISRSSLSVVKIERVHWLSILQAINFLFFLANTIWFFLENFYLMYAIMVWTGLMGGASYVNAMYLVLEHKELQKKEKELALTLTGALYDLGILLASITSLILINTAFKHMG